MSAPDGCRHSLFHDKGLCGCKPDARGKPSRVRKETGRGDPGRTPGVLRRSAVRRITGVKRKARDPEAEAVWSMVRQATKNRALGWCEVQWDDQCAGRGHHAHHVLPRSRGGTDDLDGLLWSCAWCHQQIHANPKEAEARGFLRSAFGPPLDVP